MIKKCVFISFLILFSFSPLVHAEKALAKIRSTQEGKVYSGQVVLEDTEAGLKVSAQLSDFTPGDHGFHIHQFGDCSDSGKAAGGHYNPAAAPHGHLIKDGAAHAHAGDLGNVTIGEDGKGSVEVVVPGLSLLSGPHAVAGRSVVVHESKDDFSQPLGNAGARIGCGEIVITP